MKPAPTAWIRRIDGAVDLDWDDEPICQHKRCDGKRAYWVVGWKRGRVVRVGGDVAYLACEHHARMFCRSRGLAVPITLPSPSEYA